MFNPYNILKLIIFCCLIMIFTGITVYKYATNTNEIEQLKILNQQKNAIIMNDKKQFIITNDVIYHLTKQLESDTDNFNALQHNFQNIKTKLTHTNRINFMLLHIIQQGEQSNSLSQISNTTSRINAETDSIKFIDASRITDAIIQDLHQCNQEFIKYKALINWVESQQIIYGNNNGNI